MLGTIDGIAPVLGPELRGAGSWTGLTLTDSAAKLYLSQSFLTLSWESLEGGQGWCPTRVPRGRMVNPPVLNLVKHGNCPRKMSGGGSL